jgi:transcriptional regulator with XRE-family HTH domain
MDLNSLTASRIKGKREELNIKQSEIAKLIQMSASAYSRLENGEIQITINALEVISRVLKTSVVELMQINDTRVYNFNNNTNVQQGFTSHLNVQLTPDQFSQLEEILKK